MWISPYLDLDHDLGFMTYDDGWLLGIYGVLGLRLWGYGVCWLLLIECHVYTCLTSLDTAVASFFGMYFFT